MLTQSVVREFGDQAEFVVENYGSSELAKRFGVTRYPAIFIDDILVAKPKDFGFYGKGEGSDNGRYAPWKDAKSHERYRSDLKRTIELVLAGNKEKVRKDSAGEESAKEIQSLPALQLIDLSGKQISSEDLTDRAVLVEFWATWCPPCRGTLQWLGDLKSRYGERLVVLAIAMESDEAEVRKVTQNLKLPLRWAMGSPEIARSFGDISAFPTLFLFDSRGRQTAIYYGAPPEIHPTAEAALKSILK